MNVFALAGLLIMAVGKSMTAAEYFQTRFRFTASVPAAPVHIVDSAEYTALPIASQGITLSKEHKAVLRGFKKLAGT
jgi:hypothetical protein